MELTRKMTLDDNRMEAGAIEQREVAQRWVNARRHRLWLLYNRSRQFKRYSYYASEIAAYAEDAFGWRE